MSAQWLNKSSDFSARATALAEPLLRTLAQPTWLRRIRLLLFLLLVLWALFAVARILWFFVPQAQQSAVPQVKVINPVTNSGPASPARKLDIGKMRAWHLFGEAGATVAVPPPAVVSARDGIEKDARQTRLDLKLRGIVASTQDGLGHAIIEHRSRQAVYAVEDKLPVSGRVTLAKVMPRQVILDNGGTYERLELFDKSALGSVAASPVQQPPPQRPSAVTQQASGTGVAAMANDYRSRLYSNPQSLAEVVRISAVRQDGALRGYRIAPGKDKAQFEQLGFKSGDVVTSVNGVPLDNPASTMKLYNMLRSASEVTFELLRDQQPHSLSVSLDEVAP